MGKILCIEDSREFQMVIERALSGFNVQFAGTLGEARKMLGAPKDKYDLILLDLSLPDGSGINFLSEYRLEPASARLPVFVITSESEVSSKVTAFKIGADDYICKPFNNLELKARVEAKLAYLEKLKDTQNKLSVADLVLDTGKMSVADTQSGKPISDFTPIEFKLLYALCKQTDNILTRNQLIDHVWGSGIYITDRTVDAHISHLRKKIEPSRLRINTVVGMGYKASVISG